MKAVESGIVGPESRICEYYRLAKGHRLVGWLFNPYKLLRPGWRDPTPLSVEEFDVLVRCDGQTPWGEEEPATERALLARYVEEGVVESLEHACPLDEEQRYHLYPCWEFKTINWAITGRCNYNCKHCFAAKDLNPLAAHPTAEQCLSFVEELERCGIRHVWLTGGEPLLRDDFLQLAQALSDAGIRIEDLGTNGSLITPALLDVLEAMGQHPQFNVSFDGLGHHDWMRGVPGAEQRTLDAIACLKQRGYRVKVQYCLWDANLDTLRDTTCLLDRMGVDHLRIIRVVEAPRWKHIGAAHTLDIRAYYDCMLDYVGWYLKQGVGMYLDVWSLLAYDPKTQRYDFVPVRACGRDREHLQPVCADARNMPFVASDGSLTLCNQISGWEAAHGVSRGNVYESPLQELLSDSAFTQQLLVTVARVRDHNPQCGECPFLDLCDCGCRAVALATTDDLLAADQTRCAFFYGGYLERFDALFRLHGCGGGA